MGGLMGDRLQSISNNVGELAESHRKGVTMDQDIEFLKILNKGTD